MFTLMMHIRPVFPSFHYFVCAACDFAPLKEMLRHCLVILIMMTKSTCRQTEENTASSSEQVAEPKKDVLVIFMCGLLMVGTTACI